MISIVIPTYNRAHLLPETLNSILNQSDGDWECILVDDGSTDETWEVLQKYASQDPRFQIFKREDFQRPKGANACRNLGIEKSKGNFILFLDSDDFLDLDYFLSVRTKINQTESDLIIFQSLYFDETNSQTEEIIKLDSNNSLIESFFAKKTIWLISNPLIKTAYLKENKINFNEELLAAQDWEFFMKILSLDPKIEFDLSNDSKVKIRKHEDNISLNPRLKPQKFYHYYKARQTIFHNYLNAQQKRNLEEYYKKYSQELLYELIKMRKFKWAKEIISNESLGLQKGLNLFYLEIYKTTTKGLSKIKLTPSLN